MTYQVSCAGNRAPLEITQEFFKSELEAMDYYGVTYADSWFWESYSINLITTNN